MKKYSIIALFVFTLLSQLGAATLTNAVLTSDSILRTNQNLDVYGTLDWEMYSATSLAPYNRKSSPLDRIALSANLGSATLSANAQVNTSFDYTNGTTPVAKTGDNPVDLRMLSNANFTTNDYYTLDFTAGSVSQQVVTVWGNRRVADVRITASLTNAAGVVSELIGGGTTTEIGWFYQIQFTPDHVGDVLKLKIQGLDVGGVQQRRLGISAAALEGTPPPQTLFVHGLFQNSMVLQRDMDVPVWGRVSAGATVTLKLDGTTAGTTTAGPNGEWFAQIGSHPHDGGTAHTLEISSPDEISIVLTNVVFGDVYIASGQSNMARTMYNLRTDSTIAAEIANANYPLVRQVTVSETTSLVPLQEPALAQGWTQSSPATVGGFSATGYFFAKNVHLQAGVPVGLLFSAWGAKEIQRFLAPEGVAAIPELSGLFQFVAGGGSTSSFPYYDIYNAMIAPLIPYGVKGAIWYQGEWNSGDGDFYHQSMRALIAGWRKNWGQGNFPFYYVQLPNYSDGGYPSIREAQLHTLSETNTGMAVTIDTGDGELHPMDKQDVGYRLAQWAVAKDDGQSISYSGPLISGVTNEGGQLRISFDHVDGGLMVGYKFTNNPVVFVPGAPLDDFEVAGADKVFVAATATIAGNTVVVSNAAVTVPVYARYCYVGWPTDTNHLYNLSGLPASPFRTDEDYPLTVQSGTGGNAAVVPGAVQVITANAAPSGKVFDRWIGSAYCIANLNASSTTVTMPRHALYLLATYRDSGAPTYTLTVNKGYGSSTSQAGSYLNLEAQPAAPGWYFDHWAGNTQMVANVLAPSTTLQMPTSNVTVTAVYNPFPVAAQFAGAPTSGSRPLAVTFTDQSTGNITNLLWTFGDGHTTNTAGGAVLSHTYTNAGSYTVTLAASGTGDAATNTRSGYVTVSMPPSPNIRSVSAVGTTNLLLTGTGGPTNGTYYYWLLSSTNVALPLADWSVVSTNLFNPDGSFSNALPVIPGIQKMFYRLQLP